MNKNELRETYELIPDTEDIESGAALVKILKGPFEGAIVKLLNFKIVEATENEDDMVTAEYSYDITHVPEYLSEKEISDIEGEEFEQLLGDIIIQLLMDMINNLQEQ